jgi:23S rRNA pseudouridine1911/1915/1917 synthase
MAEKTQSVQVTPEQVGRVDAVVKQLTGLSHSRLRGLFDHGHITVNEQPCGQTSHRVAAGDIVTVTFDPQGGAPKERRRWDDRSFSIVYEDADLIVVNKAAHVLTVATVKRERNTLASRVSLYLQQTSRHREALVAHRLDRGVSGLLVMAKTVPVLEQLRSQFRDRKPDRRYIAIVAGHVEPLAGTFESYLHTTESLDQVSTFDEEEGKLAITHYRVQKMLADTTVAEVRLETGRRNQIRVHFADSGHPVLGDERYGKDFDPHPRWSPNRLALHAVSLGFDHPRTGKHLKFQSELPQCMQVFIAAEADRVNPA